MQVGGLRRRGAGPSVRAGGACQLGFAGATTHRRGAAAQLLSSCGPGGDRSRTGQLAQPRLCVAVGWTLNRRTPAALRCRLRADPLPSFRDVPPGEKQLLFVRKLHLCAFTFDFTTPTAHVREKEMKRQTLLELVDYVNSGTGKFTEQVGDAGEGPPRPAPASRAAVGGRVFVCLVAGVTGRGARVWGRRAGDVAGWRAPSSHAGGGRCTLVCEQLAGRRPKVRAHLLMEFYWWAAACYSSGLGSVVLGACCETNTEGWLVRYWKQGAQQFANPDARPPAPFCPSALQVSEDIVFMLSSNLFRALPPSQGHGQESYDLDEEEPNLDPAWPHLQVGAPGGWGPL